MSEAQIQAIKDVIKMTPRLSIDCLNSIRVLMEKANVIKNKKIQNGPPCLLIMLKIIDNYKTHW